MRPKTILVCLTTAEQTATILKVAVPLARKHGAHLVGLRTVEAILVYPGIAMHIPEDTFLAFRSSQNKKTAEIEDIFEHHTSPEDFVSEFRVVRADTRSATDRMIESARAADLVIMAQDGQDTDPRDMRQMQRDVIVTGAFGHSSTYDFVIGATSYELLRDHKVPILFSK